MNAHVGTGIRELTAQELDQVTGGRGAEMDAVEFLVFSVTMGGLVGSAICWLWDTLFG
jgi:hypothetical protein